MSQGDDLPETVPADGQPSNAKPSRFAQAFGVTEEELRARGIDPNQYASDHFDEAIADHKKRKSWMTPSRDLILTYYQFANWAYIGIFAGFALLLLSDVPLLHSCKWTFRYAAVASLGIILPLYLGLLGFVWVNST
jgi:hypothetical protein